MQYMLMFTDQHGPRQWHGRCALRWDHVLVDEAEALLHRAARAQKPGRFQLEAAIQSVHAARRSTGSIHWPAILALYEILLHHTGALWQKALGLTSNPAVREFFLGKLMKS